MNHCEPMCKSCKYGHRLLAEIADGEEVVAWRQRLEDAHRLIENMRAYNTAAQTTGPNHNLRIVKAEDAN